MNRGPRRYRRALCLYNLTLISTCATSLCVTTPTKKKALLASGTLNPRPEAVLSDLFKVDFFDPCDLVQVKYEMLRAHSVDEDPIAEVCRQFGLSRESFYRIQKAFRELGFCSFLPGKRGRKGPVKLKGEVLEFALAKQKENPDLDPGRLADLIQERFGIPIHRTTVLRGMKKKRRSSRKGSARNFRGDRRPSAGDL
jgi:transposase